jgi:putative transposase
MRLLDEQYTATPFDGVRRMTAWLRGLGYAVNLKHVRRLLRQMGLDALYAKPRLSQPAEGQVIYPYLLRGVTVTRSNQVWSADITYIRLQAGLVSLVAVIDWFSRDCPVVGAVEHHGGGILPGGARASARPGATRDF